MYGSYVFHRIAIQVSSDLFRSVLPTGEQRAGYQWATGYTFTFERQTCNAENCPAPTRSSFDQSSQWLFTSHLTDCRNTM